MPGTHELPVKYHGVLRVDEKNPHHFVFEDGTRFYMLAYECDWLWALDVGSPKLKTINPFLNKLASYGFNYVILDTYAHDTSWRTGRLAVRSAGSRGMPPRVSRYRAITGESYHTSPSSATRAGTLPSGL